MVAAALARSVIDGSRLMLEPTETAIIYEPQRPTEVLEALKGLGVRIAMDDFGTGYTLLAYLQRLPIDLLKIDSRFVTGMLEDADSTAIVCTVLSSPPRWAWRPPPRASNPRRWCRCCRSLAAAMDNVFTFPKRSMRRRPSLIGDRATPD